MSKDKQDMPSVLSKRVGGDLRRVRSKRAHRELLDQLFGRGGEENFAWLRKVRDGEIKIRRLAREPGPEEDAASVALIPVVEEVPSFADRLKAVQLALAYQLGRPPTQADIRVRHEEQARRDLSPRPFAGVETQELEALLNRVDELEARASRVNHPDTVDAEVVESPTSNALAKREGEP